MNEDLNFSQWLEKYFYDGELKMMFRSRCDGIEYSITDLEERYLKSRQGCPITASSGKSAEGKIKNGRDAQ